MLSLLYVVTSGHKYMVIDGCHRLKAMAMVRDEVGDENFETVSCIVYTNPDPHEALSIGYQKNRHAGDVLGMTDFDKD